MVNLPFNRNNTTDFMWDWMEVMVGDIVKNEAMNSIDFLIITILMSIVIYLIHYIRKSK